MLGKQVQVNAETLLRDLNMNNPSGEQRSVCMWKKWFLD